MTAALSTLDEARLARARAAWDRWVSDPRDVGSKLTASERREILRNCSWWTMPVETWRTVAQAFVDTRGRGADDDDRGRRHARLLRLALAR